MKVTSDSLRTHGLRAMGFSRPEYWSGWLFPSPRDLPHPGIKPRSPTLQANSLPTELPELPDLVKANSHKTMLSAGLSYLKRRRKSDTVELKIIANGCLN